MSDKIVGFILTLPAFYFVNEGCRSIGVTNIFAVIGLSVLILVLYDLGRRLEK